MNGKWYRRIGVLDFCLVFFLILGIVGWLGRAEDLTQMSAENDRTATVTLMARELPYESMSCLDVGEMLYLADGSAWGRVTEIECLPAQVELLQSGIFYSGAWDATLICDLRVTVEVMGREQDGRFLRDGKYAVLRGSQTELYGMRMRLDAVVEAVVSEGVEN